MSHHSGFTVLFRPGEPPMFCHRAGTRWDPREGPVPWAPPNRGPAYAKGPPPFDFPRFRSPIKVSKRQGVPFMTDGLQRLTHAPICAKLYA
jgi:hypothetical protein